MRLGLSLFAIAVLAACGSSSNHASSDAGSDAESDAGLDTGSSSSGGGSSGSSGSGGSGTGSSGGSLPMDGSGQDACRVTLTGAVNVSFPCTTTTEYFTASNRSVFTIDVADSRPLQVLSIVIESAGQTMSGTWSSTDPGASGGAEVQEGSTDGGSSPIWQVTAGGTTSTDASAPEAGPQDGGTTEGSYTLDITVSRAMPNPTGESFGATGTFAATLPAVTQSGATGTVTIHANF
jgi:hypothetical protein